jgi:hypothetical protein
MIPNKITQPNQIETIFLSNTIQNVNNVSSFKTFELFFSLKVHRLVRKY